VFGLVWWCCSGCVRIKQGAKGNTQVWAYSLGGVVSIHHMKVRDGGEG